jgi:thiamine biosynthesis lipoprotein
LLGILIPWATRRQLYCHHLCPHGAAQEWLGRLSKFQLPVPPRLHQTLRLFPALLLSLVFLGALQMPRLELSLFEPFDFWVLGKAALIPAVLALAGLGFSLFIPMAYCRYGCPTGALLSFVRSHSNQDRFGKKDACACLVLACAVFLHLQPSSPTHAPAPAALRGTAFGSTWCVKMKAPVSNTAALHAALSRELERIETTLSHWSKNSATTRFNESLSTEPQDIPEELAHLVAFALRIHNASNGDYDITVAPLVAAWGYGPPGSTLKPPSPEDITNLLSNTGSDKLVLSPDQRQLRKTSPKLALDLGSILQGYAVDRLFEILERAGCQDFLIEVGGELRSRGAWPVAIENPADARHPLQVVTLQDAALATSGLARARRKLAGETVSHIISPKTGYPVEPTLEACSVQSATCLEADGWSTALIASGLSKATELAKKEKIKVWILDAAGAFKQLE